MNERIYTYLSKQDVIIMRFSQKFQMHIKFLEQGSSRCSLLILLQIILMHAVRCWERTFGSEGPRRGLIYGSPRRMHRWKSHRAVLRWGLRGGLHRRSEALRPSFWSGRPSLTTKKAWDCSVHHTISGVVKNSVPIFTGHKCVYF